MHPSVSIMFLSIRTSRSVDKRDAHGEGGEFDNSTFVESFFDTLIYAPASRRRMEFPLREKIAGEIALSEQPGKTMRKWREELRISQTVLARHMRVSPSRISDSKAGRRT